MEGIIYNLQTWNPTIQLIAFAVCAAGFGILLYHAGKLASIRDKKEKYDYINLREIDLFWYATVSILTGAAIYVNTLGAGAEPVWFFVRIFVTIMLAIIIGIVVQNLLRFYYPFYIEKRLKKLRFSPRVNPANGNMMKLLGEDEEDVHLDEGMQAEENLHSINYDVWIDEETGYTKIEKYNGHLHALQCPECNYQTYKVKKEELIFAPTNTTEGELAKFYNCAYCGHKSKKIFTVAPLERTTEQPLTTGTHTVAGA